MSVTFYQDILSDLQNKNIIIFGGHALYLLNKKYNLNLEINLDNKDLDLIISSNNIDYITSKYIADHKQNPFINKLQIWNQSTKQKVDIVENFYLKNMVINGNIIHGFNYNTIKPYIYQDTLYNIEVSVVDIFAYYGIIKSTGLLRYKSIINSIEITFPDIKEKVKA